MKIYSAKWKRNRLLSFNKTEKNLIGHRFDEHQNKMIFFYMDGSVKEVADWRNCEISLGVDWVAFTKSQMEKESGQAVRLEVG